MNRQHSSNLFGIIVILIGAYLLAYNLNLPIISGIGLGDIIAICWPLLFVAWGVEALGKRNYVIGTIFTVLGLHFLTGNLGDYIPGFAQISKFVWPMTIILIGVFVLLAPPKSKSKGVSESDFSRPVSTSGKKASKQHHYTVKTYAANTTSPVIRAVDISPQVTVEITEHTSAASSIEPAATKIVEEPWEAVDSETPPSTNTTEPPKPETPTIPSAPPVAPAPPQSPVPPVAPAQPVPPSLGTEASSSNGDAQATPQGKRPVRQRNFNTSFNSRKLVFTEQDFQEGDNTLELSVLFGDVAIQLPATVSVSFTSTVTLGDVQFFGRRYDGISQTVKDAYTPAANCGKHLIINASVVLGDLRIKA